MNEINTDIACEQCGLSLEEISENGENCLVEEFEHIMDFGICISCQNDD